MGQWLPPHPGPDYGGEDGSKIAALVDRMNDESNTIPKLKASFASGTPIGKKDVKAYPQSRYEMKGTPTVAGDEATARVEVRRTPATTPEVKRSGAFVKEGTKWKIKSAPLP